MSLVLSRKSFLALAAGAAAARGTAARAATPLMRAIPKSGEKLPAIGLGTSLVFDRVDADTRRAVVQAMLDNGGTLIDTAPSYGGAEAATGDLVQDLKARARLFLATKVASSGKEQGIASIEASFKKLKTDVIDLMQVHNLIDTATQLATLRDLKAKKRIRYIGITHYEPQGQEELANWLAREPLDFVQLNYSLDVRGPEKRLLPLAADKGVAVLVNVPLGRGRILSNMKNVPLPGWAPEVGVTTWAQMLLKFVISHPAVTVAIPATGNPQHMAENMIAAQGPLLTAAQRQELITLEETR